jgi:hypothetical protein
MSALGRKLTLRGTDGARLKPGVSSAFAVGG